MKAEDGGDEEEVLDEETKRKDQLVREAIDGLMREYAAELNAPSQDEESQRRKRKKEKKEEVQPYLVTFCVKKWYKFKYLFLMFFLQCFFFSVQDDINTIDIEEDKRDLISREISKFRDTHKVKWLF